MIISLVIIYTGILILGPIIALILGAFDQGLGPVLNTLGSSAFLEALWLSLKIALAGSGGPGGFRNGRSLDHRPP